MNRCYECDKIIWPWQKKRYMIYNNEWFHDDNIGGKNQCHHKFIMRF
jgi:hypothetical protein